MICHGKSISQFLTHYSIHLLNPSSQYHTHLILYYFIFSPVQVLSITSSAFKLLLYQPNYLYFIDIFSFIDTAGLESVQLISCWIYYLL